MSKVKEMNSFKENGNLQIGLKIPGRLKEWVVVPKREKISFMQKNPEYKTLCLPYWWEISKSTPSYFLPETLKISSKTDVHSSHKSNEKRQQNSKPTGSNLGKEHITKLQRRPTFKTAGSRRKFRRRKKNIHKHEFCCTCFGDKPRHCKFSRLE